MCVVCGVPVPVPGSRQEALQRKKPHYKTFDAFSADLQLIVSNACTYNAPGSEVYLMAQELKEDYEKRLLPYVRERAAAREPPSSAPLPFPTPMPTPTPPTLSRSLIRFIVMDTVCARGLHLTTL